MTITLNAQLRDESGKGTARALRNAGKLPAVIYGAGKQSKSITVDAHEVFMAIKAGHFLSTVLDLKVDDKTIHVLPRDVQRDVVSGKLLHVDFMRFDPKRELHVSVEVRVEGAEESPGIKHGGIVQMIQSEIELICRADKIPAEIVISIADKEIGESVHISEVTLPEGVRPAIDDRDFTIAAILAPKKEEVEEPVAAAEGEAAEAAAPAAEESKDAE